MPKQPKVSIIVPTFRGEHRLPALLDALAGQEFDGDFEVIVVLDGPSEAVERVLAGYADRLPVRRLVQDPQRGVAAALNRGYAAAAGRVLIRCDDDLTPGPGWLAGHLAQHTGDTPVGVISVTRDVFDPVNRYVEVYARPANQQSRARAYALAPEERWTLWAACASIDRAAWAAAGGFDESFGYGEDSELGYRLHRAGVTMLVDPALEVAHRGPIHEVARRVPRAYLAGESRRRFAERHPEAARLPQRPRTPWEVLVAVTARVLSTEAACARAGRALDPVIRRVPAPVARKLIALAVEAAGRAGARAGAVSTGWTTQKLREIAAEQTR
ncbi:glycosyltransferase family 2 protein [Granulicoccus phenolivorans]|uniref:glycosyltransferase family 2 protein n=1 Tax=Granulicoccus phenolivorans TaxID=266854 RepID=UPI000402607D|nr:glycosyltransferase [Granulicoccus phenolivorans]